MFKLDLTKINYDSNLFRRYFITSIIPLLIRFGPVWSSSFCSKTLQVPTSSKFFEILQFFFYFGPWKWNRLENVKMLEKTEKQRLSKFLFFQCLRFWKVTLTFDKSDWLKSNWTWNRAQSMLQRLQSIISTYWKISYRHQPVS